jgi:hypothetical protein
MVTNNFDSLTIKIGALFLLPLLGSSALISSDKISASKTITIAELADNQSEQDVFGMLIINKGEILVNRMPAMTGQTILKITSIRSGEYADAIIDLGPRGLIAIRENTNFALELAATSIAIKSQCKSSMIEVRLGEIMILPSKDTLSALISKTFDKPIEFQTKGETYLSIDCSGKAISAGPQAKKDVGLLSMVGNVLSTVVNNSGALEFLVASSVNISGFRP